MGVARSIERRGNSWKPVSAATSVGGRVHTEAAAPRALGARAFAIGDRVVFDEGQYDPQTAAGRRLLAHELTHVVQQQGRGVGSSGVWGVGAEGDPFEEEAERVAERVMSGDSLPALTRTIRNRRCFRMRQASISGRRSRREATRAHTPSSDRSWKSIGRGPQPPARLSSPRRRGAGRPGP
jgi:hypothetical protein